MTLKELTDRTGWTLKEVSRRCNIKGLDAPLLSKIRCGLVEPSTELQAWLDMMETEIEGSSVNYIELSPHLEELYLAIAERNIDNPITRTELAKRFDKNDSQIRKDIQDLRLLGVRVVSSISSKGYWLDENGGGYEKFRTMMQHKALSILSTIHKMDAYDKNQFKMEALK